VSTIQPEWQTESAVVAKLSPSTAPVGWRSKLRESAELLRDHVGRAFEPVDASIAGVLADIDDYDARLRPHAGISLDEAQVLEIGYGARPYRLIAQLARGVDAKGVDAEVPILRGSASEYVNAWRRNGAERVVKSLVRHVLFDRRERQVLKRTLKGRGWTHPVDRERFLVGDAGDLELPAKSLDLVYSEDVFEHISLGSLDRLIPRMASWLKPTGLALIRPNVFTGITGGHLVEWNRRSLARGRSHRRTEPWSHLRGETTRPNTSLNRLARADYRALLSPHFSILDEVERLPGLGREFLSPELAAQLDGYGEDELFSNQVLFVMTPRRAS
jgi:hypothetical protein